MIFLKNVHIENYRNLSNINLKDFKDLNIVIGPNNCGKTSILNSINLTRNIEIKNNTYFRCEFCREVQESINENSDIKVFPLSNIVDFNEQRLREKKITISQDYSPELFDFILSKDQVSSLLDNALEQVSSKNSLKTEAFSELFNDYLIEYLKNKLKANNIDNTEILKLVNGHAFRNNLVRNRTYMEQTRRTVISRINEIIRDFFSKDVEKYKSFVDENFLKEEEVETLLSKVKREYFLEHLSKTHGQKVTPLYTLKLKQYNETYENSDVVVEHDHFSFLCFSSVQKFMHERICYIEDNRLKHYKDKDLKEYLREKDLAGEQIKKLIGLIRNIVDSNIIDYKQNSLDLLRNDDFVTSINEQGSGVRSLICLVSDVLSLKDNSIVLIDEPELGLNPSAKKEFLKFLVTESYSKQIFITTHDPTFVNPTIWDNYKENLSIHFYSLKDKMFKKIDLDQNNNDPSTFGGYLPHTTSLKRTHIYVEGASDVYIFQEFLRKYLISLGGFWAEKWNNVGIYHLSGDFWQHMLYTIPKSPYKCLIILDGDKKELARKVCEQYNNSEFQDFVFCTNGLEDLEDVFTTSEGKNACPVYCLEEDTIEDYFRKYVNQENYVKKRDGPEIARRMRNIPKEFKNIFSVVIRDP